ncbi:MAG: ribonuclease II [Actinobacteria bacterium 13_2_20CM_2_72_6]|nr:MAG: ribonuclease II [Actinobacteria bacterium 13_2_20CM_2_72_6]
MVIRRLTAPRIDFSALRRELELPERFPPAAQAEADQVAAGPPPLPKKDRTDLPFVTIDPPESMDLDQAMHLERRDGGGYRVHYAIADVAAYVRPDGALAEETWRRGETVYFPDGRVPLHPPTLSEGAASLLPDQVRAAVLWTIELDADGGTAGVRVERAAVRSRAKLNYAGVQADADAKRLAEPIALLPELGALLVERGLARGAINLPIPAQEVEPTNGGWHLVLRGPYPVENFNAQISLLTGMAAARLMLDGNVGLLRTMPPPPPAALDNLRAVAASLGITWPDGASAGRVIATVDPADPRGAAFLDRAAELMRGAGYTAFDGAPPAQPEQAAVAAPYAHVTAPLRRLADRYTTEVCLALSAGTAVPDWARVALPKLPEVMAASGRRAGTATRAAVDLTEAVLLADRVGEEFDAAVLDVENGKAVVAIADPPVQARCAGAGFAVGTRVRARLTVADPGQRRVLFERV